MIWESVIVAVGVFLAGLYIRGGLITLAIEMSKVAREIHIHAETMNEIKHSGIGIDN